MDRRASFPSLLVQSQKANQGKVNCSDGLESQQSRETNLSTQSTFGSGDDEDEDRYSYHNATSLEEFEEHCFYCYGSSSQCSEEREHAEECSSCEFKNPMDFPEILESFLKCFSDQDLLRMRLVCTDWNTEACKILKSRPSKMEMSSEKGGDGIKPCDFLYLNATDCHSLFVLLEKSQIPEILFREVHLGPYRKDYTELFFDYHAELINLLFTYGRFVKRLSVMDYKMLMMCVTSDNPYCPNTEVLYFYEYEIHTRVDMNLLFQTYSQSNNLKLKRFKIENETVDHVGRMDRYKFLRKIVGKCRTLEKIWIFDTDTYPIWNYRHKVHKFLRLRPEVDVQMVHLKQYLKDHGRQPYGVVYRKRKAFLENPIAQEGLKCRLSRKLFKCSIL